jgi:purine-nucleoside phosphorylase
MGFSNMDFVVRELHAVVAGPMAVLRLGTCGGLQEHVPVGTLVLVRAWTLKRWMAMRTLTLALTLVLMVMRLAVLTLIEVRTQIRTRMDLRL